MVKNKDQNVESLSSQATLGTPLFLILFPVSNGHDICLERSWRTHLSAWITHLEKLTLACITETQRVRKGKAEASWCFSDGRL